LHIATFADLMLVNGNHWTPSYKVTILQHFQNFLSTPVQNWATHRRNYA